MGEIYVRMKYINSRFKVTTIIDDHKSTATPINLNNNQRMNFRITYESNLFDGILAQFIDRS